MMSSPSTRSGSQPAGEGSDQGGRGGPGRGSPGGLRQEAQERSNREGSSHDGQPAEPTTLALRADPEGLESQAYRDAWQSGPFSSYDMLEYMLKRKGDGNLLERIAYLKTIRLDEYFSPRSSPFMDKGSLWRDEKRGVCTIFTIQAARQLTTLRRQAGVLPPQSGGEEDTVLIYNTGKHRLARCKQTGIVIDSSFNRALIVEQGVLTQVSRKKLYKFNENDALLVGDPKNLGRHLKGPFSPLGGGSSAYDTAIGFCLHQYMEQADTDTICLLRHNVANELLFDGWIRWNFKQRTLKLSWKEEVEKEEDHNLFETEFYFGRPEADKKTNEFCQQEFKIFLSENGPGCRKGHRKAQFELLRNFHLRLWTWVVQMSRVKGRGPNVASGFPMIIGKNYADHINQPNERNLEGTPQKKPSSNQPLRQAPRAR